MARWKPRFIHDDSTEAEIARLRAEAVGVRNLARFIELCSLAACAVIWLRLGGARLPLVCGIVTSIAIYSLIDRRLTLELRSPTIGKVGGWLAWLRWMGFLAILGIAEFLTLFGSHLTHMWALLLFVAATLWIVVDQLELGGPLLQDLRTHIHWVSVLAALVTPPVLSGWVLASFLLLFANDPASSVRAWLDGHTTPIRPCQQPRVESQPIRVAVTLSGGGYRAALVHAGVLSALDDACVPIHFLSTVSGGSIVGASYALGVPPKEFAARLIHRTPGLPNSLLSVQTLFKSRADIYRKHLADQYFGERTLAHLPDTPLLLVNATNPYTTTNRAREILLKRWTSPELWSTITIADIVAASAAFPGAFGPVEIIQTPGVRSHSKFLIDGGIVENLGVDGLRRYLVPRTWNEWEQIRPSIVIISDASGYAGRGERLTIAPAADEILLRANAIQFDALHRLLLAELTGIHDLGLYIAGRPAWRQYYKINYPSRYLPEVRQVPGRDAGSLVTVVIPATADTVAGLLKKHPSCVGPSGRPGPEIQAEVASLSTLTELPSTQARNAYWLGYALGGLYRQAIECGRRDLAGAPCTMEPAAPPLTCDSL